MAGRLPSTTSLFAIIIALLFHIATLIPAVLAYIPLSNANLHLIPSSNSDFDIHTGSLLSPILIPRVPDTPGSTKVLTHFIDFFTTNLPDWTVEWHNSTSATPITGPAKAPTTFRNLIFRRDPPWAKEGDVARLTLVAHHDSMYRPEGFVGATDSAAPCAMLMHVARSIDSAMTAKWQDMYSRGETGDGLEEEKGVQILFLDGEEAWVKWTNEDSIYGARALAKHWGDGGEGTRYDASSMKRDPLDAISLFVLFDLLGAPDPNIPSYFQNTHWAYRHLADVERRLRAARLLETRPERPFLPESDLIPSLYMSTMIRDDHVPFMHRGVEVLHVIPTPFPSVWHTMLDDGEHLDSATVRDWAKIMTVFVAEWMELDGFLGKGEVLSGEKTEL